MFNSSDGNYRPRQNFLHSTRSSQGGFRRPPPHFGIPPYIWITAGGTTLLIAYNYYAYLEEVPLTHRKRWIATSPAWEKQLGDQEYLNLLRQFRNNILPPDHRASRTVQRVGARIAVASREFAKQENCTVSDAPYTYTVVCSDMANAFVLPGNHVFVMTGLFQFVKDEDELAGVLGHEVAHNLARHAGEKISGSVLVNMAARLTLLIDPTGLMASVLLPAATLFRELPHSRIQETEADEIGVFVAAQACYDPRASKRVFAAMKNAESSKPSAPPEFLSTHPSHESRISNFDKWIPSAMRVYESDAGERCRRIRHDMALARQYAARGRVDPMVNSTERTHREWERSR